MDSTQPQAATSSSSTSPPHTEEPSLSEPKVLRTSARVKAAKQKEKQNTHPTASSSSTKRSRDNKGKGKETADEARASKRCVGVVVGVVLKLTFCALCCSTRRATLPASSALTINEPTKDTKGKKRAAPEDPSEDDETTGTTSANKKPRRATSAYSLRPRTEHSSTSDMTRKTRYVASADYSEVNFINATCRNTSGKGKVTAKSKAMMAATSSSRVEDEDVDMIDAECGRDEGEHRDDMNDDGDEHDDVGDDAGGGDDDDDEDDDEAHGDLASHLGAVGNEPSAMSIFGDYRQLGSYMMGISGRLKTMLNNIKSTADPTTRLLTLQELSELLSISTEDTLAGSFQVEAFIRELVRILGGTGNDEDEGDDDDGIEQDEDAALAAALAMSAGGGAYQGDENLEAQVLACRCLANLMEALPGVAHTVVYHGAIPVLCSKLIEISYIDLAEQTLSVCSPYYFLHRTLFAHVYPRRWRRYQKSSLAPSCERVALPLC